MTKRLLLLGGLAIVSVILSHAAQYGQIALFEWADSYLPVSVANLDALNSASHYGLLIARIAGVYTVPAFLIISGFFSAYIGKGGRPTDRPWRTVFRRVWGLAAPYVIWSAAIFAAKAFEGTIYTPPEYILKLLTTGASGYLYFVPVLCSCYLLSPFIVSLARRSPRLLIFVAVALQVSALVGAYARRFDLQSPVLVWMGRITPGWSLPWWVIYFVLGTVVALNIARSKELLTKCRWPIAAVAVASWLLHILEWNALMQAGRANWIIGLETLSGTVSAISASACFLAFPGLHIPRADLFYELGKRSYGLYLAHEVVIGLTARIIHKVAPRMLAYQIPLVLLLFIVGLGLPLLAMEMVSRWPPTRGVYRYLFG